MSLPCKNVIVMMFSPSPTQPMIITRNGFSTSVNFVSKANFIRELDKDCPAFNLHEALSSLKDDAQAECEEEDAIEECTKKGCSLPPERKSLRGGTALRDLAFCVRTSV
jgi:hypothetical protein